MATFVLVHGAWEAGWIWTPLAKILRAKGHEVFAPSLTGLGERMHLASRAVNLETHVADILAILDVEDLRDVTLVGHSYSGMVAGIVADRAADRIGTLIYLDAFIPAPGKSMLDLLPAERSATFEKLAAEAGDGWRIPALPAKDWDVDDPEHIHMLESRSSPHPIATMRQKAQLSGMPDRVAKIVYLLAMGRRGSPFPAFAAKARAAGWPVEEIATHHFPMLSKPRETADIFERHTV